MDYVQTFSQLTRSELADISKFEHILSHHYEKFKYACRLLDQLKITKIESVSCGDLSVEKLLVDVKFDKKKDKDNFAAEVGALVGTYGDKFDNKFITHVHESKKQVSLVISYQNGYSSEEEIYGT